MKRSIIVLGAGGHAKVVIEILHAAGYQVSYCVGDDDSPNECMGIPVLKGDEQLFRLYDAGYSLVFPAIGSNTIRERAATCAIEIGYELVNAISPYAIVSQSLVLGRGVAIMSGVVINAECKIDDLAIINTGVTVDHDCHIGFCVHIAPQCALAGNVKVGKRAFLGIGTTVIPDIIIGNNAITGAGSVVISNIPAATIVVGHPARLLKRSDN